MSSGDTQLTSLHGLKVIPGLKEDVTVGIPYVLDQPLYWSLPDEFLGDKVDKNSLRKRLVAGNLFVFFFPSSSVLGFGLQRKYQFPNRHS